MTSVLEYARMRQEKQLRNSPSPWPTDLLSEQLQCNLSPPPPPSQPSFFADGSTPLFAPLLISGDQFVYRRTLLPMFPLPYASSFRTFYKRAILPQIRIFPQTMHSLPSALWFLHFNASVLFWLLLTLLLQSPSLLSLSLLHTHTHTHTPSSFSLKRTPCSFFRWASWPPQRRLVDVETTFRFVLPSVVGEGG